MSRVEQQLPVTKAGKKSETVSCIILHTNYSKHQEHNQESTLVQLNVCIDQ